jgi:hypothetical protein
MSHRSIPVTARYQAIAVNGGTTAAVVVGDIFRKGAAVPGARRVALAMVVGVLAAVGTAMVAVATRRDAGYLKYYTVAASYQGQPETLTEIAHRFLGAADRAADIYDLNADRTQPDGGTLQDATAPLRAGWVLVLPWDATGDGVRYGLPPTGPPSATSSRKSSATPSPSDPAGVSCAATGGSSTRSDWAALRLAPDQAWSHTRGQGQLVAIVDSGTDASLPQLAGHVTVGADVTGGTDQGHRDCLGSGTAMAGLVVGQPVLGSPLIGIAPDAAVMPVRVVATSPRPRPADEVTAIQAAIAGDPGVIALGAFVDPDDPAVAPAVAAALARDIVVVAGARTAGAVRPAPAGAGLLRVGGVGVDGQVAADYAPGGVDVVAPGINVASMGLGGSGSMGASGTQYAVALVAGEAALVRAQYPELGAAQVVHRIEATADTMAAAAPDRQYGWGMINPGASVTADVEGEGGPTSAAALPAAPPRSATGAQPYVLGAVAVIGIAAAVLLAGRIRRLLRPDT